MNNLGPARGVEVGCILRVWTTAVLDNRHGTDRAAAQRVLAERFCQLPARLVDRHAGEVTRRSEQKAYPVKYARKGKGGNATPTGRRQWKCADAPKISVQPAAGFLRVLTSPQGSEFTPSSRVQRKEGCIRWVPQAAGGRWVEIFPG